MRPTGDIKWRGEHVFIGEAFAGELVGLAEQDSGAHIVRFSSRISGSSVATFVSFALLRRVRGYASLRKRR